MTVKIVVMAYLLLLEIGSLAAFPLSFTPVKIVVMAYLVLLEISSLTAFALSFIPAKRPLSRKISLANGLSLIGIVLGEFLVAILSVVLNAAVLSLYSVINATNSIRRPIGICVGLIMWASIIVASLAGCYCGGRLGWEMGAGHAIQSSSKRAYKFVGQTLSA